MESGFKKEIGEEDSIKKIEVDSADNINHSLYYKRVTIVIYGSRGTL